MCSKHPIYRANGWKARGLEDYSQEDDAGLDLIDFYVLPHYLTAPFKKVTEKIMTEFSDLNLCPINNRQGIVIDGDNHNK